MDDFTPDKLVELTKTFLAPAIDYLITGGEVYPKLVVVPREGPAQLIDVRDGVVPGNKPILAEFMRRTAKSARAMIFVAEAWTLDRTDVPAALDEYDAGTRTTLEDHPRRHECITVAASSPFGFVMLIQRFDRDSRGNPVVTEEPSVKVHGSGGQTFRGWFANPFDVESA